MKKCQQINSRKKSLRLARKAGQHRKLKNWFDNQINLVLKRRGIPVKPSRMARLMAFSQPQLKTVTPRRKPAKAKTADNRTGR